MKATASISGRTIVKWLGEKDIYEVVLDGGDCNRSDFWDGHQLAKVEASARVDGVQQLRPQDGGVGVSRQLQ